MLTKSALVTGDAMAEYPRASVHEVVRQLLDLVENSDNRGKRDDSGVYSTSSEVILIDTEVDGNRYLLVRMPLLKQPRVQLSPREREIVRMVAKGHPNKVIADVLNISSWTVCTHLRRIFAKLGVGSRAAMVAQLLEMGVLRSEHPPTTTMR